jgi:hypothetical protein
MALKQGVTTLIEFRSDEEASPQAENRRTELCTPGKE